MRYLEQHKPTGRVFKLNKCHPIALLVNGDSGLPIVECKKPKKRFVKQRQQKIERPKPFFSSFPFPISFTLKVAAVSSSSSAVNLAFRVNLQDWNHPWSRNHHGIAWHGFHPGSPHLFKKTSALQVSLKFGRGLFPPIYSSYLLEKIELH